MCPSVSGNGLSDAYVPDRFPHRIIPTLQVDAVSLIWLGDSFWLLTPMMRRHMAVMFYLTSKFTYFSSDRPSVSVRESHGQRLSFDRRYIPILDIPVLSYRAAVPWKTELAVLGPDIARAASALSLATWQIPYHAQL